ncbi:MAG TPA: PAS domain-containing protein [Chitinispirillaceae bacterium]|nr:PAS domain-containing protein [Chitinispirillaceae bacterium]
MDADRQQYFDAKKIEILDSSPDLLFRLDRNGTFLEYYANEELLYTEPQNFLGKRLDQTLPDDIALATTAAINKALSLHRPQTFNYQMIVMGALRSYEARILPAGNDEVLAHIHDTTDQLLTVRLLQSQKDLIEGLTTAPDLKTMLSLCLHTALSLANLDCGTIYLVDQKNGSIDLARYQGFSEEFAKKAAHYEIGSRQGQIIMMGKPFYIDYEVLASQLNRKNEEHLRGSAIIPVKSDKGVIAAFLVSSRSFEVIPALSRHTLETIASIIGGTLEHLRDQNELLRSQRKLKALFDSIQDCVLVIDCDGIIITANPVVSSRLGYAEHDLTGMPLVKIYPDELHGKIRAAFKRAVAGENVSCVIPVVTNDNFRIPMETRFYSTEWEDCQVFIAIGRDISQRKTIEMQLRKNQMYLNEAQRLGEMGHWCYNVQDDTIDWSDELFHLFGVKKGEFEMSMENIEKMIHPEDLSGYIRCREQIALNNDSTEYECRIIRSDNEIRFVLSRIKRIKDESGGMTYILGTFQDVTERKLMKEALFNSQRLESLGIMAAGIAHDFNNLLCGLFGNIEMMKQLFTEDERVNNYFDRILKGYLRARDLTTQLQSFSKGSPLSRSTVNINDILNEACALALSGSTIACEEKFDRTLPVTTADANQLSQVFNNILINARQAMIPGGKIIIQTNCRNIAGSQIPELECGTYIEVIIKDNGAGIPPENLKKVFDPFFTTKQSGSGLGLAISYSIIKKHNGKILICSEPGKGTTITILLPVVEIKVEAPEIPKMHEEKLSGRILLLDNEEIARVVAEDMLRFIGFDVVCASDGREALNLFNREKQAGNPFNLLLLDLTVPGGFGGQQVMNEIRKIDSDIPGIIASGYLDDPVLENPQSYGFSAKVDKPYQLEELWRTLGNVLKGL